MNDIPDKTDSQPESEHRRPVRELPGRVLDTYARLWQLETWLRRMVYVELRALKGDDWAAKIEKDKIEESQKMTSSVSCSFFGT